MLSVFKVLETSRTLQLSIRWFSKIYNFKTKFPELYEHVDPSSVHLFEQPWIGSKQVVKWRCDKGPDHVWDATIDSRIQSYNRNHKFTCVYCIGKRVSITNSLATRFPEIAKEWCYEKNGDLTPEKITYGSSKNVWWRCPNHPEHLYFTSPNDRTYSHRGCPYCNGMLVCSTNNLAVTHPYLAAQWDRERNKDLRPESILPSYPGNVWWRCPDDPTHVWEAPVNLRVRNHWGCPYCSHRRFKDLSLASMYPEMAKDWDYAKNENLSPDTISPNSEKLIWWKCEHGVEWKQSVISRKKSYLNGYHRCLLCRQELKKAKGGERAQTL